MPSKESFDEVLRYLKKKGHFHRGDEAIDRVLTGVVGLDWLLGGGIPRKRIVELFGFEGSGKTTTAAEFAKAFQAAGERVLYLDYEHSVDLHYFRSIGVDLSEELFLFDQPDCLEIGTEAAIKLIRTGSIGLFIVDSVPAMTPKAELEGEMTDETIALQARKLGRMFRSLIPALSQTNTTALFINHLRDKIGGNPYSGDNETTPGGKALKFYSTVRILTKRVGFADKKNKDLTLCRYRLKKQKANPLQSGAVEYVIGQDGIQREDHLKRCLVNSGLLEINGQSYIIGGKKKLTEKQFQNLMGDPMKREELTLKLVETWNSTI